MAPHDHHLAFYFTAFVAALCLVHAARERNLLGLWVGAMFAAVAVALMDTLGWIDLFALVGPS